MKLSIGMMVKNEEKNLERCLESLKPLLNAVSSELIIVDTGSTDQTVEIAQKYTDKIYFHPWENDYSKMRNITVRYARGEWFMFVDADEELKGYEPIVQFISTKVSKNINAAAIQIDNIFQTNNTSKVGTGVVTRLFRKTAKFGFRGVIHEEPIFEPPLAVLGVQLLHYGYPADDPELRERKLKLYEPILRQAIEEDPDNVGLLFYLSNTIATFKNHKEALEPAVRAYETAKRKNLDPVEYFYVYSTLAMLYNDSGEYKRTVELAQEGLKYREWAIDLWFCLAKAQGMLKQYQEAIASYQKYLYYVENYDQFRGKDPRIISNSFSHKDDVYYDLAVMYKEIDQKEDALEALEKLETIEMIEKAVPHQISLYLNLEKYQEIKCFYNKISKFAKKDLGKSFCLALETLLLSEDEIKREEVARLFHNEDSEYGLLNTIRLWGQKNVTNQLLSGIKSLSLSELGFYYGDIFYFVTKMKLPLNSVNLEIQEQELELLFKYLTEKYPDFAEVCDAYLQSRDQNATLEEQRVHKILRRIMLQAENLDEEKYDQVLDRYIHEGIGYIRRIYRPELFENDKPYLLANKEEIFFYCLDKARFVENSDQAQYVRYLKKALLEYPDLKKGIEVLLDRLTKKIDVQAQPAVSAEMQEYARIVKANLKQFIQNGMFKEAREIIQGYEEIIPNDPEIAEFKADMEDN
ncbi:glycosyltransferase [Dehalobacter sp. TBBPA1]|uniref:glycosyltransferase n=1 Tax=Dehalobacter sp. TBBPA1 TaxID=3235037 RepID=UPI0034A2E548